MLNVPDIVRMQFRSRNFLPWNSGNSQKFVFGFHNNDRFNFASAKIQIVLNERFCVCIFWNFALEFFVVAKIRSVLLVKCLISQLIKVLAEIDIGEK